MNERWARPANEPGKESAPRRDGDRPALAAAAPSAHQVFAAARPPADAVVVYKRRRQPVRTDANDAAAADTAAAPHPQRGPRVFQLASSDAAGDPAAAPPPPEAAAPARRRRRRNAQQSPGEVRHIVIESPYSAAAGLASSDYHAAWQALQAVGRTLEQIRTAQRIKAALDELPF